MDIKIKRGTIGIVKIRNNNGVIDETTKINSNTSVMRIKPVFLTLVDGLSMADLLAGKPNEIIFKVDCTHTQQDFLIFNVTDVDGLPLIATLERNVTTALSQQNLRVMDVQMVRDAMETHQEYYPSAASANAGFDVIYYQAKTLTSYQVISADILKSITNAKPVEVLYPKNGVYQNFDFDQFGLHYEQLQNVHIVRSVWGNQGFDGNPEADDILYMPIVDQFFKVTDVAFIKNVANRVNVFELTLAVVVDNSNIAKQDDVLDLSLMLGDSVNILSGEEPELATIIDRAPMDWNIQRLSKTELTDFYGVSKNSWVYGIIYHDNQWLKLKRRDNQQTLRLLDNTDVSASYPLMDHVYAAKLVVINNELDVIAETMYYTSITLPHEIKPLYLIQHVTRKPRDL